MSAAAQLSLIAALAPDAETPGRYLIGNNGGMPWHFPSDLKYFRNQTMGKPILMGRKTFASLGNKPLPGRENLVLSRSAGQIPRAEGVHCFTDLEEALAHGRAAAIASGVQECMVIGGGQLYQLLLPRARRLYITWINREYRGDTHFPELDLDEWHHTGSEWQTDDKTGVDLEFARYDRIGD